MFRFNIRDVLWLMVVVGLLVVSWRERQQKIFSKQRADAALRVLDDEGMEPQWLVDGRLLVKPPLNPAFSDRYAKVYFLEPLGK